MPPQRPFDDLATAFDQKRLDLALLDDTGKVDGTDDDERFAVAANDFGKLEGADVDLVAAVQREVDVQPNPVRSLGQDRDELLPGGGIVLDVDGVDVREPEQVL